MNDGVDTRQRFGRDRATQGDSADDMAGAPKMRGNGASDKSRGAGNGDVHSGNFI
jgi:hypothetical protein